MIQSLTIQIPQISKTPNRQNGGLSGGANGGINGGLAERILSLIRSNASVMVQEMTKALEIPKRTIEREMKKLRSSGRVICVKVVTDTGIRR